MTKVKVYIAARGQDQLLAKLCRQMLEPYGIRCTSRWLDQTLINESHDEAQMDLDDVRAADALIVLKPKDSHGLTTGGHHVETGVALERGLPIILLGEAENVFHQHDSVRVFRWPVASWRLLSDVITETVTPGATSDTGRH